MNKPEVILQEINEGIKMGLDAISNINEKISDTELKKEITTEYDQYNQFIARINDELQNYNEIPKELGAMKKTMGWMNVQISTMDDKSDSKIAEMMLQGMNMGIIKGVKLLNENPDTEEPIKNILSDFVSFQENSVEQLKKYL